MPIRTVAATRYVTPLREGGSLPAIVEADDERLYVLKFRGAGQGPKVLIAELLAGEIARAIGLPVPELVFVELDPELARHEHDPEIRDLISASGGLNLGLAYLQGAVAFDPLVERVERDLAAAIVCFDAFVSNVDRTPRNPNLLVWQKRLWLIDHGAALYFHHAGGDFLPRSRDPFTMIKDHVLLAAAGDLAEAGAWLAELLTPEEIERIVALIPDTWLLDDPATAPDAAEPGAQARRDAYRDYLLRRLEPPRAFVEEAIRARP